MSISTSRGISDFNIFEIDNNDWIHLQPWLYNQVKVLVRISCDVQIMMEHKFLYEHLFNSREEQQ